LPSPFGPPDKNDKLCRYNDLSAEWDCAADSFTTTTITRHHLSGFSAWAVGNDVGPTALRLTSLQARPAAFPATRAGLLLVFGLLWLALRWKTRPNNS
jgi:hypothetical protein